jgi:hypothetical protein
MKYLWITVLSLLILFILVFYNENNRYIEPFENLSINLGNYLCAYFYNYALSITEKKDFNYQIDRSIEVIKELPTYIKFNEALFKAFQKEDITTKKIKSYCNTCIWYCEELWILNMWKLLKPTVHNILHNIFIRARIKINRNHPIIHFRCADTPFVKHPQYFLQKYDFFKNALAKYHFSDKNKTVILMTSSTHLTKNKEQTACLDYITQLKKYIISLGYNCRIQTKTNIEDFVDLFYAPFVISTGSSFSFMSGFFGVGKFISTEHCLENKKCIDSKTNTFIKGYNIHHSKVESYFDTESVLKMIYS